MKLALKLFRSTAVVLALLLAGSGKLTAQVNPEPPAAPAPPATNVVPAEAPEPAAADMAEQDSGRRSHSNHNEPPIFLSNYVLEKGQISGGDRVVIKGSATINGTVDGDAVVVAGDAKVNGTVEGDLVIVMGSLELGPEANIKGQVVVVGGSLEKAPGAKLEHEPEVFDPATVPGLSGAIPWVTRGLMLGRPLPFSVGWAWVVAGVFLLINLLLQMLFPRPIEAALETMEKQPITSFFMGLLAKLLTGLISALLVVSIVGIIALPFLLAAVLVAFLFGKITIYRYTGQQLGRQTGLTFLTTPAMALIAGTGVFYLLYAIPFIGFVAWGFTGIIGLGGVVLTAFQQYRREKGTRPPPAALAAPAPPEAPPASTAAAPQDPVIPPFAAVTAAPLEISLLPRAGFWIRLAALVLDAIVFVIPAVVIARLFSHPGPVLLLWLAYHVFLWTKKGTTIGGIVTHLQVVRLDGRPVDFTVALVRALASVFSALALGLGFMWAGLSRDKQSWHDKIAGTVIVKVPKGMSLI